MRVNLCGRRGTDTSFSFTLRAEEPMKILLAFDGISITKHMPSTLAVRRVGAVYSTCVCN
jgi:hypothetical protein